MSDDFELELKQIFLDEAVQILEDAEAAFLQLETDPSPAIIDEIFRIAHTFKGSSKAAGFEEIGQFTHEFETLLTKFRSGEYEVNQVAVSLCLRSLDHIRMMVDGLRSDMSSTFESQDLIAEIQAFGPHSQGGTRDAEAPMDTVSEASAESPTDATSMSDEEAMAALMEMDNPSSAPALESFASPTADTPPADAFEDDDDEAETFMDANLSTVDEIRGGSQTEEWQKAGDWESKFSDALSSFSETANPSPSTSPQAPAPKAASSEKASVAAKKAPSDAPKAAPAANDTVRVNITRIDGLLNSIGELVILQSVLKERMEDSEDLELKKIISQLSKITKEVQDVSMQLRMVPVKPVFQKMQRIVRDTSELLKKEINFRMVGEDVEIDKTVLDMIGDPLTHLTRNSVDHGIEDAQARQASGKGKVGQIELRATQESGRLILSITDDGKGLDTDRLYQKAIEKGIVKPGAAMSTEDIHKLIFHAGFSTKDQVTELSGRGVGMDVVRSNIEALGGEIQILSEKGKGTCMKIFLPLSLAIIDAIVVKANHSRYVIPLSHIQELVQLSTDMLHDASGIGDVLMLRGDNIRTYSLRHLLGLSDAEYNYKDAAIIVIRTSDEAFAIVVDEVVSRQQVVVKKLGDEVNYLVGFSGSTILGDGLPALILEMQELVKMAAKKGHTKKHIQLVKPPSLNATTKPQVKAAA